MGSRVTLFLITGFWLAMNFLLWRQEFGGRHPEASPVPAPLVLHKILTAPDSSSLNVLWHGQSIGFCHWQTGTGEEWSKVSTENIPAGMTTKNNGFQLRLEGSAVPPHWTNRLRFDATLTLGPRRVWQELELRVSVRPVTVSLRAIAADETLHWQTDEAGRWSERVLKFSELRDPGAWVRELSGPLAGALIENLDLPLPENSAAPRALDWEAWEDTIPIRHSQVRIYRLQTRLLGRFPVTVIASRVGEILRLELPGELELVNDQLGPG